MPEGDDELVITFGEVMHRWFCVSMVSEMGLDLWCVDRPNLTQYDHDTPLWDGALLITLVGTSKEPHY